MENFRKPLGMREAVSREKDFRWEARGAQDKREERTPYNFSEIRGRRAGKKRDRIVE